MPQCGLSLRTFAVHVKIGLNQQGRTRLQHVSPLLPSEVCEGVPEIAPVKGTPLMATKKALLQKLLKGIETGDPEAATVVNEGKYIQHNPRTAEGSPGLAELFARLARTNPRVTFVRVFEDGDFAFAHNEYDFDGLEVAFEVFRFEHGKAVEHWDNIQIMQPPNPSGRSMLDGETGITDLNKTETNRELVTAFAQKVLIARRHDLLESFVSEGLLQHDPECGDGVAALRASLEALRADGTPQIAYERVHRVLAEGNFVLCMSEGRKDGLHSGLYDLFRVADGKLAEQWNTISTIAPRSEWKAVNGRMTMESFERPRAHIRLQLIQFASHP